MTTQVHPATENATKKRFGTDAELEAITGVKRRTWQEYRRTGRGPRFYRIGGAIRYEMEEVWAWIKANGEGGDQATALSTPLVVAGDCSECGGPMTGGAHLVDHNTALCGGCFEQSRKATTSGVDQPA